jgi:hypothetical protein
VASTKRAHSRRPSSHRDRGERFVAPVLDATWTSPYTPSSAEREANEKAIRSYVLRRQRPWAIAVGLIFLASLALISVAWFVPVIVLLGVLIYGWRLSRQVKRIEERSTSLAGRFIEFFKPAGSPSERMRLVTVVDRLGATFGIDAVSCFIVEERTYNAALLASSGAHSLFVTSAMMRDFELIELEGVVAHCMARQRLGMLTRLSVASLDNVSSTDAQRMVGRGLSYRADEVAAAAIRYPLGLAGALARCERQSPSVGSYFSSPAYDSSRWVWFNMHADRTPADLSDLDDVALRSLALGEW